MDLPMIEMIPKVGRIDSMLNLSLSGENYEKMIDAPIFLPARNLQIHLNDLYYYVDTVGEFFDRIQDNCVETLEIWVDSLANHRDT